jgi:hypothetical protein
MEGVRRFPAPAAMIRIGRGSFDVGCLDVSTPRHREDVGDAKSAYRISRFSGCPGEGEPIRWRFCLRPLKTVAKRVLFSNRAASAKVCTRSKTQISEVHFKYLLQRLTSTFLRFTSRE